MFEMLPALSAFYNFIASSSLISRFVLIHFVGSCSATIWSWLAICGPPTHTQLSMTYATPSFAILACVDSIKRGSRCYEQIFCRRGLVMWFVRRTTMMYPSLSHHSSCQEMDSIFRPRQMAASCTPSRLAPNKLVGMRGTSIHI
jgi:hypothetical protein